MKDKKKIKQILAWIAAAELEDSLYTYGNLMSEAGIEVSYTPPEYDIPLISGDPERLKQVFLNLLDNAAKHGGDGGKAEVSLSIENDSVVICIRDYGHGIPENELPFVKNRFYKGSSKNRGSGLLSLLRTNWSSTAPTAKAG